MINGRWGGGGAIIGGGGDMAVEGVVLLIDRPG